MLGDTNFLLIVFPGNLRYIHCLQLAHECHTGMVKIKQKVEWPRKKMSWMSFSWKTYTSQTGQSNTSSEFPLVVRIEKYLFSMTEMFQTKLRVLHQQN